MTPAELVPARNSGQDIVVWSGEQQQLLRDQVCPGASDGDLAFFAQVCTHKGLDPFADEIIATMRWSGKLKRDVLVIQETVAGLRTIAERTGLYGGQDEPLWCGPDKQWTDVWLDPTPPAAAKVRVWRKDWVKPATGIATYASYVQLGRDSQPVGLWKTGVDFMLWKCAEAAALKRAFRRQLEDAGVNTRDYSPPERASMEARLAGLTDDDRHALVRELTAGRTDSTRDLDDPELLELRAEVARLQAQGQAQPAVLRRVTSVGPAGSETHWYDPTTGERVDPAQTTDGVPPGPPDPGDDQEVSQGNVAEQDPGPGPERTPAAPAPAGTTRPEPHPVPRPGPGERQDQADLRYRLWALVPENDKADVLAWLVRANLDPASNDISAPRVAAVDAELDRRGYPRVRPTTTTS